MDLLQNKVTGINDVILRLFEAQKLRIATVYLKFLQRRKNVKEQDETVRLFRYNSYNNN